MRVAVITRHGGPEVIRVEERPAPAAGPGQVVIDVRAAGVNFADTMARVGMYPDAPKPPCVVGYEVAGTVAAVGDGVRDPAVGERVIAGTRFGGYAEQVAAPASEVIALPDGMSFEQGAALPVNYATAWSALIRYGSLRGGEVVLIHAAAGGVGIAATQIAAHGGAEIWGTASPSKHDAIRGFGVAHPIDYTRRGWERGLPRMDLILDAIGGASFRRSYRMLRAGGRLVCFGASSIVSGEKRDLLAAGRAMVQMPRFNLVRQMQASKSVIGLNLLTLWDDAGTLQPWIEPLGALLEQGAIKPVVAQTFALEDAGEAHRYIAERRNIGKVVLVP